MEDVGFLPDCCFVRCLSLHEQYEKVEGLVWIHLIYSFEKSVLSFHGVMMSPIMMPHGTKLQIQPTCHT